MKNSWDTRQEGSPYMVCVCVCVWGGGGGGDTNWRQMKGINEGAEQKTGLWKARWDIKGENT